MATSEPYMITAAERDAIVLPQLRKHLTPLGLKQIKTRQWIDGSSPPVRRMFELRLYSAAALKPCWGFSLDFVPHPVSGRRVAWHRTDKSAMLDVYIDPIDAPVAKFHRAAQFKKDLGSIMADAVQRAVRDWQIGSTYFGMLELISAIREQDTNCWGYNNSSQLPLAHAFLAAKVGAGPIAERELAGYVKRFELESELARKLKAHLAALIASTPPPLDPSWLRWHDGTVRKIGQAVHKERDYSAKRLSILADALEEAGCSNEDVLAHLRGAGPHVRGCWVVDLLLGRE